METEAYHKQNDLVYECPNCESEITISNKDDEISLVFGDIITNTCPECGEILTIKLY